MSATQLVGRTRGDQVVVFDAPSNLKGKLVTLQIVDAKSMTLFGQTIGADRATHQLVQHGI